MIGDSRRRRSCDHSLLELLRQRVYALALGYEDLNDHHELRNDLALPTATSRVETPASPLNPVPFGAPYRSPNRCRHPRGAVRAVCQISTTAAPPTDPGLRRHGHTAAWRPGGRFSTAITITIASCRCMFCGRHLLVSLSAPQQQRSARHTPAILSLLVKTLRRHWPKAEIIFRGDSGFCRWKILRWCERHDVRYIVGLAKKCRIKTQAALWISMAESLYDLTGRSGVCSPRFAMAPSAGTSRDG